jgi:hypothetical protein
MPDAGGEQDLPIVSDAEAQRLRRLMHALESRSRLVEEGVYRRASTSAAQNPVLQFLGTGANPSVLETGDGLTLASALKRFLRARRMLSGPARAVARSGSLDAYDVEQLLLADPDVSVPHMRELLGHLLAHAHRILELSSTNRITEDTLAMLWAPFLFDPWGRAALRPSDTFGTGAPGAKRRPVPFEPDLVAAQRLDLDGARTLLRHRKPLAAALAGVDLE